MNKPKLWAFAIGIFVGTGQAGHLFDVRWWSLALLDQLPWHSLKINKENTMLYTILKEQIVIS